MPIDGDFAALDKVIRDLAAVAQRGGSGIVDVAAANIAQELAAEVQLGFRRQRDPYGEPWAPLKRDRARNVAAAEQNRRTGRGRRSSKGKILRDTGRLANSLLGKANGGQVVIGTNVEYAPYHQYGTRHMVDRRIIPMTAFPEKWASIVAHVVKVVMANRAPGIFAGAAE